MVVAGRVVVVVEVVVEVEVEVEVETMSVGVRTALLVLALHAPRAKTDTASINARAQWFLTMSAPVRLLVPRTVSTQSPRQSAGLPTPPSILGIVSSRP